MNLALSSHLVTLECSSSNEVLVVVVQGYSTSTSVVLLICTYSSTITR